LTRPHTEPTAHSFRVLNGQEEAIIGRDLFGTLGIRILLSTAVPPTPQVQLETDEQAKTLEVEKPHADQAHVKEAISDLLEANQSVSGPCTLPGAEFSINPDTSTPIYKRPYPIPMAYHAIVRAQIEKWVEAGVVVAAPPHSGWLNPLTTAPKKGEDGKIDPTVRRVCLDPTAINNVTKLLRHPMPLISDIVQLANGAAIIVLRRHSRRVPLMPPLRSKSADDYIHL
jgi:hypothetical protein